MLMIDNVEKKKNHYFLKGLMNDKNFFKFLLMGLIVLIVAIVAIPVARNYRESKIDNEAVETLKTLKVIDTMMVGTFDLPSKMLYLKQLAQVHGGKVSTKDGEISLQMQASPEQCQAFFNHLPDYITYYGYSLVTNGVNQGFDPYREIPQDIRNIMCNQPNNTIVRHYFIVNGDIVDFNDLSKSVSANDNSDNKPTPVDDNANTNADSNSVTQVNNNDGSATMTQSIVIDNGNTHIVINNYTGSVQQDDSDDNSDDSDDNGAQSQAPCDPRN